MVYILGVDHLFEWDRAIQTLASPEAVRAVNDAHENNKQNYREILSKLIREYSFTFFGEEGGAGLFLKETIKKDGCESTFLELASKSRGTYFLFDLPTDELVRMGIEPTPGGVEQAKAVLTPDVREPWFPKLIARTVKQADDALCVMGSNHATNVSNALKQSGYVTSIRDCTVEAWYKTPDQAVRRV